MKYKEIADLGSTAVLGISFLIILVFIFKYVIPYCKNFCVNFLKSMVKIEESLRILTLVITNVQREIGIMNISLQGKDIQSSEDENCKLTLATNKEIIRILEEQAKEIKESLRK